MTKYRLTRRPYSGRRKLDNLDMIEKTICAAEEAGKPFVELETRLARYLHDVATGKRTEPRGRQRLTIKERDARHEAIRPVVEARDNWRKQGIRKTLDDAIDLALENRVLRGLSRRSIRRLIEEYEAKRESGRPPAVHRSAPDF
jgi:hypothetical protein